MRKLGKSTDKRMSMLNGQAAELLWYGKLNTTVDRAKEVRRIAEKMITLAVKTYTDTVIVKKDKVNVKGETVKVEFKNDGGKKLAARRKMMATLPDLQEVQIDKEKKEAFKERTKEINHPLIEKIFNEYGPRYAKRKEETGQGGGYTRIIKLGSRRGDNAALAVIELV